MKSNKIKKTKKMEHQNRKKWKKNQKLRWNNKNKTKWKKKDRVMANKKPKRILMSMRVITKLMQTKSENKMKLKSNKAKVKNPQVRKNQ